jgi:hypothetical protein
LAVSELSLSAQPAAYEIRDGRIIAMLGTTSFEVTVFKAGEKDLGARSKEFGYANYEIMDIP